MSSTTLLSRHRLRQPYRHLLIGLWLAPLGVLLAGIVAAKGMTLALFDPRFLLILALMALPAYHIWQQGIDVLRGGIVDRLYLPRRYAYTMLHSWEIEKHPRARVLIIRDETGHRVITWHTAHLSDLPDLLDALRQNIHDSQRETTL